MNNLQQEYDQKLFYNPDLETLIWITGYLGFMALLILQVNGKLL